MIFTRTKTNKNGATVFTAPGMRAAVILQKSFFGEGGAPESIELNAENLTEPGQVKPTVTSEEAVAKAKAAAEKAAARAAKATERAQKAAARAAKLVAEAPAQTEAPAETVQ